MFAHLGLSSVSALRSSHYPYLPIDLFLQNAAWADPIDMFSLCFIYSKSISALFFFGLDHFYVPFFFFFSFIFSCLCSVKPKKSPRLFFPAVVLV